MQQQSEEWIVVKKNKRKHRNKEYEEEKLMLKGGRRVYVEEDCEKDIEQYKMSICFRNNCQIIQEFLTKILKNNQKCKIKVVCLGLGNFETMYKPKFQFYFLKYCLLEHLGKKNAEISFQAFDPVFTSSQVEILEQMNGKIKENIEISQNVDAHIFFMPHCERFLYQKLVMLKKQSPTSIIVIGNSINAYIQRCNLISQSIPQSFVNISKIEQKRIHDFKETLNDTFIYIL